MNGEQTYFYIFSNKIDMDIEEIVDQCLKSC